MQEARLFPELNSYLAALTTGFAGIPAERKTRLEKVSAFISMKTGQNEAVLLTFICTHNSRRSHMSQLWAQAAASYYGIDKVQCYSGGTQATAFNPRTVRALQKAGFSIEQQDSTSNPLYLVQYAKDAAWMKGFSKPFGHDDNPQKGFAAVMTCSDADEACPFVPGAEARVSIPYEDPKEADKTPLEEATYDECCRHIATEMLYVFSKVR